jgi:hypothetical protein
MAQALGAKETFEMPGDVLGVFRPPKDGGGASFRSGR